MVLLHCDEQMRLAEVTTTETRRGFSACHADILKVDIKIDSDRTGSSAPPLFKTKSWLFLLLLFGILSGLPKFANTKARTI